MLNRVVKSLVVVAAVAVAGLFSSGQASADVFYAGQGTAGFAGSLYTLDSTTGAGTLVGALLEGLSPHGVSGMAFHPTTGLLYATTSNTDPTFGNGSPHLMSVDPSSGAMTDIGLLFPGASSSTMSDITFTSDGTLYGWHAAGDHSLYTINLATGAATIVAVSDVGGGFGGGALAADLGDTVYSMPDSVTNPPGTLRTVSTITGQTAIVAMLSGGPIGSPGFLINSADVDSSDTLYGINNRRGSPFDTHLVTISKATGVITDVGASVDRLDALAIQRERVTTPIPEPASFVLLGMGACGLAFRLRRKVSATA